MIHRALLNVGRIAIAGNARNVGTPVLQKIQVRSIHKGVESTPPMRFMGIPEKLGLYFFICFAFLSYPTYVLMNLDNMRPKGENTLGEEALAERERRIAARGGQ